MPRDLQGLTDNPWTQTEIIRRWGTLTSAVFLHRHLPTGAGRHSDSPGLGHEEGRQRARDLARQRGHGLITNSSGAWSPDFSMTKKKKSQGSGAHDGPGQARSTGRPMGCAGDKVVRRRRSAGFQENKSKLGPPSWQVGGTGLSICAPPCSNGRRKAFRPSDHPVLSRPRTPNQGPSVFPMADLARRTWRPVNGKGIQRKGGR